MFVISVNSGKVNTRVAVRPGKTVRGRDELMSGEWSTYTIKAGAAEMRSSVLLITLSDHSVGQAPTRHLLHVTLRDFAVKPPMVSAIPAGFEIAPRSPIESSQVIGYAEITVAFCAVEVEEFSD